jgi:hypothetical protein
MLDITELSLIEIIQLKQQLGLEILSVRSSNRPQPKLMNSAKKKKKVEISCLG